MSIHQMLYVSGAARPMQSADIDAILASSRVNNARLGVTGVLLFAGDTFIQVLEGERAAVRGLALRIRRDARHRNFMVLFEGNADQRTFAGWQMGFKRLDPSRSGDQTVFAMSRKALETRMNAADCGMMLDMILAFAGEDFLARAS